MTKERREREWVSKLLPGSSFPVEVQIPVGVNARDMEGIQG